MTSVSTSTATALPTTTTTILLLFLLLLLLLLLLLFLLLQLLVRLLLLLLLLRFTNEINWRRQASTTNSRIIKTISSTIANTVLFWCRNSKWGLQTQLNGFGNASTFPTEMQRCWESFEHLPSDNMLWEEYFGGVGWRHVCFLVVLFGFCPYVLYSKLDIDRNDLSQNHYFLHLVREPLLMNTS